MREWFLEHLTKDFGDEEAKSLLGQLAFSAKRPPAFVTIVDRAITFLGEWPSLDRLAAFQPWNKKPAHLRADPLTAVAAVDALMMRIGRVAQETGCPDGTAPLDWIEEMAESGHKSRGSAISEPDFLRWLGLAYRQPDKKMLLDDQLYTRWNMNTAFVAGQSFERDPERFRRECMGSSESTRPIVQGETIAIRS